MSKKKPVEIGKFNGRDARGQFVRGNSGRPKGSHNVTRQSVRDFVLGQVPNLPKWFAQLPDAQARLDALIRLLPYVLPRLSQVEYQDTADSLPVVTPLPKNFEFDPSAFSDNTLRELADYIQRQQTKN